VPEGRQWKRGHAARGEGGYRGEAPAGAGRIPPPDHPSWDEDAGIIDVDTPTLLPGVSRDDDAPPPDEPTSSGGAAPDEPPAHARREWRKRPRSAGAGSKTAAKPVRITAAVRGDITGQVGFLLEMPGQVWAARDPLCGRVFCEQVPAVADALTDWIVESPSLLAIFTGPAGSFAAKAVKTMIAVAPVASVLSAHHVYHSIEYDPDADTGPDLAQYAA
jgi:hypothetical protein